MSEPSFAKRAIKKLIYGIVIGIILVIAAKLTHFPFVFQVMFFIYALLGALVFILLDAPPMKPLQGGKAVMGLVLFYVIVSGLYIGGATSLPQYDPEVEKGKIEKLLRARRARTQQGKVEELLARAKELNEKAEMIAKQLKALGAGAVQEEVQVASAGPVGGAASDDIIAKGKEQWELQECYNCHKLFGQGGKKRGPPLDNIGNLMTPEQIREKILDPKSWMAEGYEKQYKKGKMPDKYKDLMFPEEIDALVAFLSTLKNPSVNTPKPIKMK